MISNIKVQGKGFNRNIILDFKKPPNGKLTLENIYVMVSRVTCWESLAILRPFDDSIFEMKPDEKLMRYDKYLEDMDNVTIMNSLSIEEVQKYIGI